MAKCVLYSSITADFRKDMNLLTGKDEFSVITIPSYRPMYSDRVLFRNSQNWYYGVKWDIVNTWDYDVEEFTDDILGDLFIIFLGCFADAIDDMELVCDKSLDLSVAGEGSLTFIGSLFRVADDRPINSDFLKHRNGNRGSIGTMIHIVCILRCDNKAMGMFADGL